MQVRVKANGTSPLLMHNPRLADPQFEITREMKAITSKRKKTDADRGRLEMLEWFGGLYEEDGRIVQPVSKLRKAIIEAGKIHKLGTAVERALAFEGISVPLEYEGPKDPTEVWSSGNGFVSRLPVKNQGRATIIRVRPQFFPWSLTITGELIDDAGLNFDELERLADLAGRAIGIGDGRKIGYGRFEVEVSAK